MRSNRTHTAPPVIEDLGDGTYYYNFNIFETEVTPEDETEPPYINYDYDQVRCSFPIDEDVLRIDLDENGYGNHEINLELADYETI